MDLNKPLLDDERRRLSAHFARWEFIHSQTAIRHGLLNDPPDEAWENLQALVENVLEPARLALGAIYVTSGFRTPLLNKLVGGAYNSQHLRGQAADIIGVSVDLPRLFHWLRHNTTFDQLILEFGRWIHVSFRKDASRQLVLCSNRGLAGETVYSRLSEEDIDRIEETVA